MGNSQCHHQNHVPKRMSRRSMTMGIVSKFSRSTTKPKLTSAPSEDSDQPGHPPSLIRAYAVRFMGS